MHASEQQLRALPAGNQSARGPQPALAGGEAGLLRIWPRRFKRIFDIGFTSLLALASLPLGLLIAVAIALDSRGPIFFAHTRTGRNQRPFRLWKFRSMVANADEILDAYLQRDPERSREWALTHKLREDPRITRVGRFLRKTSLDELPQLWNVLRGDMSLIGPRPIVAEEVAKYGPAFALYSRVLPGLTGLWQVSGRNDTDYSRRVELDCYYIRHWTVTLDLNIVLHTVRVIVRGHGAY